jgi:ABC-type glycerol-3-phosphate transport system substrate-binding protein
MFQQIRRQFARPWVVTTAALAVTAAIAVPLVSAQSEEILVWTDAARLTGFQAYQKSHPEAKVRIVTVDQGELVAKIRLTTQAGAGSPDVIFMGAQPMPAQLASAEIDYLLHLRDYVPTSTLNQFARGANAFCTVGGKLQCLRNDLAQNVLWYNAKLMKDYGYTVPKTWEEFEALGLRVAKEHPGTVVGTLGDAQIISHYLYASNCPISELSRTNANLVRVNTTNPNCVRVAKLIDNLVKAGTLSTLSPFEPAFNKLAAEGKLLMIPSSSWFGEYIIKANYKVPAGQISVAAPLRWANERVTYTAGWGGGAFGVSKKAKNLKGAVDVALWMTTSAENQTDAPTFPAHLPSADLWGKKTTADKYYANDIYPVLKAAANNLTQAQSSTRYAAWEPLGKLALPALKEGKSLEATLGAIQTEMVNLAKASGYLVSTR